MTCEEVEKTLGTDPAVADNAVSSHIEECPRCRAAANAFVRLDGLLRDGAPARPAPVRATFLANLDARIDREALRHPRRVLRAAMRLAACLAIAAIAFALAHGGRSTHEGPAAPQAPTPPTVVRTVPDQTDPTREELAARLHSKDLTQRRAALMALAHRGDSLSRSLLASSIEDPVLSEQAVSFAGETRCRQALPRLVALASDPRRGAAAIKAIASIGDRAGVEFLISLLPDSPHAEETEEGLRFDRLAAVSVLRERLQAANPREVPSLVAAMDAVKGVEFLPWLASIASQRGAVQKEAVGVLGRLGDPRAVEALTRAWKEPDLRATATSALAAIGPPAMRELSHIISLGAREGQLRAIAVLGDLHERSAERSLLSALDVPELRVAALRALGELGDPASAPFIAAYLGDASCRAAALEALDRVADPSTAPLLARLAASSRPRTDLLRILGRVGGPQALSCLTGALGARDTAGAAVEGLVSVGPTAIPVLIRALGNPDLAGRARTGLTRITHEDLGPDPGAWERWWRKRQPKPDSFSSVMAAL